jgi:tetratricopeptide (TPR) repeat protein
VNTPLRFRMALGTLLVSLTVPVLAAEKEEENPFPYGKAELKAEGIDDVLDLLRIAGRYRNDCVRLAAEREPLARIEHFGRESKNWYREVLEREPNNAYASLCIGYVDLIIGRSTPNRKARDNSFSQAMSRFREALERRPGYADAYLYMAQVHALRQEFDKAEEKLRLILNSGIETSQIHSWMAYVLAQTKRPEEAAKHIARAIELDDPSASAQWSRQNQSATGGGK